MNRQQGSTGLVVTIVVLAVTLLVVGGIVLWQKLTPAAPVTNTQDQSSEQEAEDTEVSVKDDSQVVDETSGDPIIDPNTVKTIDITPLGVVLTYGKSLPGFEFEGKRSAAGTQYVEFSSPRLVGTKCTNDTGLFATIIKNPSDTESQTTVTKAKVLGDDTFGLSLTGQNCASDLELLKEFQASFSDNFSALRKI